MAAPSLPAVLRGEQSAVQQELQQLRIDLQNEVQQARADFSIEIQKVRTDLQKLRVEVVPELMREINFGRLGGNILAYKVVPFPNGDDPTQPPVKQLSECQLTSYLTGYCVNPRTGPTPRDTNCLRRGCLKGAIGCTR
ncbi:hypothetical protein V8E53_007104 [Lactarius tabidus]